MNNEELEFNEKDFNIIKYSQPDGFGYLDDDRALELMDLGYLEFNAKENWIKNGYKTTKKGTKLFLKWTKDMRESHGHEWETDEDGEPDAFAYSEDFHNGFKCKKCGFEFCHHCNNENYLPKCSEDSSDVTMKDDAKLDKGIVALDKSLRSSLS